MYIYSPILPISVGIIVFLTTLTLFHIDDVNEMSNWCENAGGIAIIGDDGHFKVCLDSDSVITQN